MKSHLLGTVSIYNAFLCTSSADPLPVCRLKTAEFNLGHLVLVSIFMLWGTQTRSIANPQYSALSHSFGIGLLRMAGPWASDNIGNNFVIFCSSQEVGERV